MGLKYDEGFASRSVHWCVWRPSEAADSSRRDRDSGSGPDGYARRRTVTLVRR